MKYSSYVFILMHLFFCFCCFDTYLPMYVPIGVQYPVLLLKNDTFSKFPGQIH